MERGRTSFAKRRISSGDDLQFTRARNGCRPVARIQAQKDMLQVLFDSRRRDDQAFSDFPIRETFCDQLQHLSLASTQRIDGMRGRAGGDFPEACCAPAIVALADN